MLGYCRDPSAEGGRHVSVWKNLGEHTVYENPWLRVNLADVELPDGRHLDHFLIRQRPDALATAVNENNEVLLLWRHRFIPDSWGGGRSPPEWSRTAKILKKQLPAKCSKRPGGDPPARFTIC